MPAFARAVKVAAESKKASNETSSAKPSSQDKAIRKEAAEAVTHVDATLSSKTNRPKTVAQLEEERKLEIAESEKRELEEKAQSSSESPVGDEEKWSSQAHPESNSVKSNQKPEGKTSDTKANQSVPLIVIEPSDKTSVSTSPQTPLAILDKSKNVYMTGYKENAVNNGAKAIYPVLPKATAIPRHLLTSEELASQEDELSDFQTANPEATKIWLAEAQDAATKTLLSMSNVDEDEDEEPSGLDEPSKQPEALNRLENLHRKEHINDGQLFFLKQIEEWVPGSRFNTLLATQADMLPAAYIDSVIEFAHSKLSQSTDVGLTEALLAERLEGGLDMSSRINMSYANQLDDLIKRVSITLQSSLEKLGAYTKMIADHSNDFINGTNGMISLIIKLKSGLDKPGGFEIPDGGRNSLKKWIFKFGEVETCFWKIGDEWKITPPNAKKLIDSDGKKLLERFCAEPNYLGPLMQGSDLRGFTFKEGIPSAEIALALSELRNGIRK